MIKIYHNPRCKKSRAGLKYLEDKGADFEVVEYLKNLDNYPPEAKQQWITFEKYLEQERMQEDIYKKQFKGKNFTDDEWVKIMVENPKLIKRPIVVKDYKAVWADPPENMDEILR